jgi:hypothetical protein
VILKEDLKSTRNTLHALPQNGTTRKYNIGLSIWNESNNNLKILVKSKGKDQEKHQRN